MHRHLDHSLNQVLPRIPTMPAMPTGVLPAFLLLCGTIMFSGPAEAKLRIVASLPDLASVAKSIGGEQVDVVALAEPNQDPHYVDARPSFLVPLSRADLLVSNGLELEIGWLPPLITNARNPKILIGARGYFEAAHAIKPLGVPHGKIDRSMGDIHPGGNPHFNYDPRAIRLIAKALRDRMIELDPAGAGGYRQGFEKFDREISSLIDREANRFRALPSEKRRAVVYHESFVYLFDWLGLEELTTVENKPGITPSPSHVADVLKAMRSMNVHTILQEEFYPRSSSETLAKLAGGTVVIVPGGTRFNANETYLERIQRTVESIYVALSK